MSERLKALRRIQAVHKTLSDTVEAKLSAAQRAVADAEAERTALDAYVSAALPTGALAGVAGRTAARLALRHAEADKRRRDLAAAKLKADGRLRMVERLTDELAATERDQAERKRLDDLVEAMLAATPREPAR